MVQIDELQAQNASLHRQTETLQDALQRDIDKYVPGLNIIAIRVTKPTIPEAIRKNYEAVEAERTRLKVTEERQKVVQREAETEK